MKDKRPPLFGALDIVFLIVTVAAALGVTIGIIAAKKAPSTGVMVVIILAFCLMMFLFAYRKILMRK